jgi:multidrug efflux pump subunit AcrB
MQRRWREAVPDLPGVVELSFHNSMAQSGKPIEIELRGGDLRVLAAAAADLRGRLAGYPGVFDAADSFRSGKAELQFRLLPSGEALGLTLAEVARQVRQAFHGEEAQRIPRGRDDVRVVVRHPSEQRRSLSDVEKLHVRTADGSAVPFATVAAVSLGQGFASVQRVDRERTVVVTADIDVALASPNAIASELLARDLPALEQTHGVRATFAGEQAEQRDFLAAMGRGQLVALIAIYALLAVPLRSYLQPLVIMLVIPFGAVGAALGHALLGYDLTMYSVIGIVALSGMVVNASLVLVDDVNRRRAGGDRLIDAVRGAGRGRLRAIFLTEITTFVGLVPMMFERAMFARFMIPLAISLAFGVIFASVITLLLVPCATVILEDLRLLATGTKRRRAAERIAAAKVEQEAREAGYAAPEWTAAARRES